MKNNNIEKPDLNRNELDSTVWKGGHDEVLFNIDQRLEHLSNKGQRETALISYASDYYSAASRLWKDGEKKYFPKILLYMNKALRALEERIDIEIEKQKDSAEGKGLISVSLLSLTPSELDVMQTIYKRASEMSDKIPGLKQFRNKIPKEWDQIRDFDAASLLAIRTGLKKIDEKDSDEDEKKPHTRIFLLCSAFEMFKRYKKDDLANQFAEKIYAVAEKYPWPPITEKISDDISEEKISLYGQTTRVARHLSNVFKAVGNREKEQEFMEKAIKYAEFVPDQKAKL